MIDSSAPFCGVIVVDKPKGPTSARVVAAVKKRLDMGRVGHTGTLDPMATGVLPLCLGPATKLAAFLLADDKAYTGEIVLGIETDTLDAEGQETARDLDAASTVTESSVCEAMAALCGDLEQVPPMFSALRKNGRRLHELARAGQVVAREPRSIHVESFQLIEFRDHRIRFEVHCSKGTYVRSLARDVGLALGCGAHLGSLRRTKAGRFGLEGSMELESITPETVRAHLVDPVAAISPMRSIDVDASVVGRIKNGLQLRWDQLECSETPPAGLFSLVGPGRELLAVVFLEDGKLAYKRVI